MRTPTRPSSGSARRAPTCCWPPGGPAAATALGVQVPDTDWLTPLPPLPRRPLRTAVGEELAWVRGFVAPWIGRRLRGRSSGDGRVAERPVPLVLPRAPQ